MRVKLEYGTNGVEIAVPDGNVTVLAPRFVPGLVDEEAAFLEAVRAPLGAGPPPAPGGGGGGGGGGGAGGDPAPPGGGAPPPGGGAAGGGSPPPGGGRGRAPA